METIKRQCNVVMLPANVSKRYNCTEGLIVKCIKSWTPIGEAPKEINKLSVSKNWSTGVLDRYEPQHIYFTSDEEIKEGDWYIVNGFVKQCISIKLYCGIDYFLKDKLGNEDLMKYCKKIIASTDKLVIGWDYKNDIPDGDLYNEFLPQPSIAFIEKYISEYNKGNIIEKVMVDYFKIHVGWEPDYSFEDEGIEGSKETYQFILNVSKDNTITISKVKDSWSREEVIEFTTELRHFINSGNKSIYDVDNWINKNL